MSEEVRAELSGNVWKVLITTGQEVSEGDTLIILESMKMEIPVTAESNGKIATVEVAEGDSVQEEQLLLLLNPS